jgi:hypothetical protein
MERRMKFFNSKDRRSHPCLDRSLSADQQENRTSSFIEQSKSNKLVFDVEKSNLIFRFSQNGFTN